MSDVVCANCPHKVQKQKPPCQRAMTDQEAVDLVKENFKTHLHAPKVGTPEYPAMSSQLINYKEALMKWQKAGRPVRKEEEIRDIYENKCKACDWFDSVKGRCRGCGCKVSMGSMAIFNKIKMATEKCPKGEW